MDSQSSSWNFPTLSVQRVATLLLLLAGWALFLFDLEGTPPGLQHDQTFNLVDIIDVLHGHWQIYFPANFGREPLFFYSAAAIMRAVGGGWVWGLRFASIVWAFLGLALTLRLGRRIFSPGVALLAVALMTTSFWYLFIARVGLRAVTLLPMSLVFVLLLLRAGDDQRNGQDLWKDLFLWLAAGVVGGLSFYTYLAARVLPGLPLLLLARGLVTGRDGLQGRAQRAIGPILCLVVMGLSYLPLYRYGQTHIMDQRVGELSAPLTAAWAGNWQPIVQAAGETLSSLLWQGQDTPPFHYNLPGWPGILPPVGLLVLVGLFLALARLWDRRIFLLVGLVVVGLTPDLLSSGGPLYLRGLMALPGLVLLAGVGALWLVDSMGRWRPAGIFLLAGLILVHAGLNSRAYFQQWANDPATQLIYNSDLRAVAQFPQTVAPERIFISTDFWMDLDQQTYLFYNPLRREADWFNAGLGMILTPDQDALYLLTPSTAGQGSEATVAAQLARMGTVEEIPMRGGLTLRSFKVAAQSRDDLLTQLALPKLAQPIIYGDDLTLLAVSARQDAQSRHIEVASVWQVERPPASAVPLNFSMRLVDSTGFIWGQKETLSTLATLNWRPGDLIVQLARFIPPGDIAPGRYGMEMVAYPINQANASLSMRQGESYLGRSPIVAELTLDTPGNMDVTLPPGADPQALGSLILLGRWQPDLRLIKGTSTPVQISWQAQESLIEADLSFRLYGLDENDQPLWQQDVQPLQPLPDRWVAGQIYRLTYLVQPDLTDNETREQTVMLRVCVLVHGNEVECGLVGTAQIYSPRRILTLKSPPKAKTCASWGHELQLVGYTLNSGDVMSLDLVWQVIAPPPPGATLVRYVHLLDMDGTIIAQEDRPLGEANLSQSIWLPGEYVIDPVQLSRTDVQGTALRVGIYWQATGHTLERQTCTGEPQEESGLVLPLNALK